MGSNEIAAAESTNRTTCQGVVVPLVTPRAPDGSLDESAVIRLVDHIIRVGAFPFLLGTTGENSVVPAAFKQRMVQRVCEVYSDRTVIYGGISSECIDDSIGFSKLYATYGVDFVVACLPCSYRLSTDEIRHYYESLAEESALPLILYNIPSITGMSIPLEVISGLSEHPNIVGLKDSERDFERMTNMIEVFRDRVDFAYLCGWAAQSAAALRMGADGIVPSAGNLIPESYTGLYEASRKGEESVAQALQAYTDKLSLIYQEGRSIGGSLSALKTLLSHRGLCQPYMWCPLLECDEEDVRQLVNAYSAHLKDTVEAEPR